MRNTYPSLIDALLPVAIPRPVLPRLAVMGPWKETEQEYQWEVLAAGLDPEQISVRRDHDSLIVELSYPRGSRTLQATLPERAQKDAVDATLAKGILTLIVPKSSENQHTITVKTA